MPVLDYQVTPVERDAASVQINRPDVMDADPDISKGWFDALPDVIISNLNGLCTYLGTMPIAYASSAAAATANKGSITGFVPLGAIIELSMVNGNTAAAPTIAIDGVTHTITGMPVIAQLQANSVQTYRLVKTGATALTYSTTPDYVIEYCTRASGYSYRKFASGRVEDGNTYTPTITSEGGTLTTTTATGTYVRNGNSVIVNIRFSIIDKGSGTGALFATLPFVTKFQCGGSGAEVDVTGVSVSSHCAINSSQVVIKKYDGSAMITNGYAFSISVTYTTY